MKRLTSQLSSLMALKNVELANSGEELLTQRSLARRTQINVSTVNRLYNGRPLQTRIDPETVVKICEFFNCPVGDLLILEDYPD